MYLKTQGLVLRETNYKEADKLLTVLTRDYGKRTVKARACRRKSSKLMGSAQLLVYSEMTLFEHRERYTLQEASVLEQFWGLREDVLLLSLSSYFSETLDVVAQEGVSHPELLSLILNSMYALDTLKKKPNQVKAAFELALMCLAGYEPLLDQCAVCGDEAPKEPRLHLRAGILHCASCRSQMEEGISMPLSPAALAVMRHIVWGDPKKLFSFLVDEENLGLLSDVCEAFLLTQLERGFHTLDFYKLMSHI
jgi:DNA repair protein RecO (recombination protein O)